MACQCYAHLPCLGGVLDRGVGAGRGEGWTNQIHCLLASANSHLALIYQGAEMGTSDAYCNSTRSFCGQNFVDWSKND